jgi:hypothetical protein
VANDQRTRLLVAEKNKIEALEFIPGADGGMVLGSDDEKCGGAIYFNWRSGQFPPATPVTP